MKRSGAISRGVGLYRSFRCDFAKVHFQDPWPLGLAEIVAVAHISAVLN